MFSFHRKKASFEQLGLATDCHCHVLPSVDDGAGSCEEAFEILTEMVRMGITSAVLTPHLNAYIYPDNSEAYLKQCYDEFIRKLPEETLSDIRLSLGAEYMVTPGFEERHPSQLIQFQPGKVLIEMSYLLPSENIEQTVFNIAMCGLTPVIAHPERYLYYAGKKETFEKLHDMGAEFQMNVISLSGAYGPESLSILKYILDNGWYTYIATDTHNLKTLEHIRQMRFDSSLLGRCTEIV